MNQTHILIATDLSQNSLVAVKTGTMLATQLKARVTLLHSYNPETLLPPMSIPMADWNAASVEGEMKKAIHSRLEHIRAEFLDSVEQVELAVVSGMSAANRICNYAKENEVDWVVVGTHGRTGLRRMLVGSVAEKVVRHAPCHVVAARVAASQLTA